MSEKLKRVFNKPFVIMDGAAGTQLTALLGEDNKIYEQDISTGLINYKKPDVIKKIIHSYATAGSDIICAATFNINPFKLKDNNITAKEAVSYAISIAKEAIFSFPEKLIALDITTLGKLLEPLGELTFEEAYSAYCEIISGGKTADVILIETMSSLLETKAALLAAKDSAPHLPVICSMTITETGRTFTGCSAISAAVTLTALKADVIGLNCSLGPCDCDNILLKTIKQIMEVSPLPVMVKPNAGIPDSITGAFPLCAKDFGIQLLEFAKSGVKFLGGCCGTSPEYIREICKNLPNENETAKRIYKKQLRVSSGVKMVCVNRPITVGERINPNGKPKFKVALREGDMGYIISQAVSQEEAGADVLDVNVALAELDEKKSMLEVVRTLQSVCDLPLMIDSTDEKVLEAALRIYEGRPILNSVNGENSVLEKILPIAAKYGAAVVGLTLDNDGIPKTAEGRFKIAEKIIKTANKYGIETENIIIDCLTLTVASDQKGAIETLKAIRIVKENFLGVKTILGVSNISFGLPEREYITASFLGQSLSAGLDLAIINPNARAIRAAFDAFCVLSGIDENCFIYSSRFGKQELEKNILPSNVLDLKTAILSGLKQDGVNLTGNLLNNLSENENPIQIANDYIIPALSIQGELFESGKIFLPSLILSAAAAAACFELINEKILERGTKDKKESQSNKIILAAVKGDIHDIGKNIVKVLLQSYGYFVIDMGKNVSPEEILQRALKEDIKLVGLSSLMTTTLSAMEQTVLLLKEQLRDCKVMVGGAVVSEEYAKKIGADYYSKEASGAVVIAEKVFKNK